MDGPYTHADFARLALAAFPQLREPFENDAERPHMQMHAFTRIAQRAKGEADWDTYQRCMQLADLLWRRPDDGLYNELNVSFLEHLGFDGARGAEAWRFLTPELQAGWQAMRTYNERLAARAAPKRKERPAKPRRRRK
jgi:hypothetical protein